MFRRFRKKKDQGGRKYRSHERSNRYWAKTILDASEIYPDDITEAADGLVTVKFETGSSDLVKRIEEAFAEVNQPILVEESIDSVDGKPVLVRLRLLGREG